MIRGGIKTVYPKARLDALSDSIFGVAMTLLVLDVRLPEDFHPRDADDLARALYGLMPKFFPYVLSFAVLGLRWLANIQPHSREDTMGRGHANWWLLYHLLVTCVPLATIVVGRFPEYAPSVWLYAGTTLLMSAVAFRMLMLAPAVEHPGFLIERQVSLSVLMASSLVAIAWSFVSPGHAMWALGLNVAAPALTRWARRRALLNNRTDA
jgi:uncharacterized membrane protein